MKNNSNKPHREDGEAFDPASLLPFSRRWEAAGPKVIKLPMPYRGSITKDALNPAPVFDRHPKG